MHAPTQPRTPTLSVRLDGKITEALLDSDSNISLFPNLPLLLGEDWQGFQKQQFITWGKAKSSRGRKPLRRAWKQTHTALMAHEREAQDTRLEDTWGQGTCWIKDRSHWPGMEAEVQRFCQSCPKCQHTTPTEKDHNEEHRQ
ncbi:hypothetical protein HF521_014137 [Silurus meridionalis]|uniref:Integrase zinc-binding domain-containing protein n=1 Tax=Silurus meridionalis TaxID=175797 RepID=A0A8T0AA07_SILME|nr:hypothetical protein HF521_014137 [Silurus meridionalis]